MANQANKKKTVKKKARKAPARKKKTAKKKTAPKKPPSPKGGKGRNSLGQFEAGHNQPGPGNPHAKTVGHLRSVLLEAVTDEDIKTVAKKLIKMAKNGNLNAARELFDRLFGKSNQPVQVETVANTDPAKMTDAELAAALEGAGRSVPGILAQKVKRGAEAADN